jgi:hypothetical protein
MFKKLLLAATASTALATSIGCGHAGEFVFRYKGVVLNVAGQPGGNPSADDGSDDSGTGGQPGGSSDAGDGSGGDDAGGGGDGSGSGDGGDDDSGGDDPGDDSTAARMVLSVRPYDDSATRDHYQTSMAFGLPTIIAAPSGTYGDGDVLTVCWDTEVNDAAGIAGDFSQQIQIPPSPLVRAITVAGQRVERDMDSSDMVTIDRPGASGCADLELTVPEADSSGWSMGIPFGVTAKVDTFMRWYDPVMWEDSDEAQHDQGPAWIYLDAQRVEGGS